VQEVESFDSRASRIEQKEGVIGTWTLRRIPSTCEWKEMHACSSH
jgi:hypothetical protein